MMNRMKSRSSLRRCASMPAVVIGMVVSALVLGITPAHAAQGTGGGTALFKYAPVLTGGTVPCARFDSMTFEDHPSVGDYAGTYESSGVSTSPVYAGGLDVLIRADEVFYANPTGLYADPGCTMPKATVRVSGTTKNAAPVLVGTSVACTWVASTLPGQGSTFSRVGPDYVFSLVGTCTVNGVSESPLKTREVHEGVLGTCRGGQPPMECDAVDEYEAVTSTT